MAKLFWSSDEIASYLQELDTAFSGFYSDIGKLQGTFNADEMDQLERLDAAYNKWYQGLTWWDRNAGATIDVAQRYAIQLKYWIEAFNKRTGNKLTGPGVSLLLPSNAYEPLISVGGPGGLIDKEQSDKLQTMVVAICVAVGLSAIARTLRG